MSPRAGGGGIRRWERDVISDSKKVLFLRILVGLAWADRRIDVTEREFIEATGKRLGLREDDVAAAMASLDHPQDAEDIQLLLRDFMYGTLSRAERRQLVALMDELMRVDGEVSESEQELLDQIKRSRRFGAPLGRLKEAITGRSERARSKSRPS
jgi:uncharacterized tellurite resistance protein B-like protein